ncbi:MAG: tRNA pseudouridine(55) synthase TruB [Elusimicrobiota bacterium]|jgi:tRNA pseudouridine55 synthase|nr:tRNA pseudouridine(55) synthase TruB [Elusimicrobiota bacterium]
MNTDISGLLLLDKPQGITSFKAIQIIKSAIKVKKICHCGALDPRATGLLISLVGCAVKSQSLFMKKDKVYRAVIQLGISTDTFDLDGKITAQKDAAWVQIGGIENVLKNFRGEIEQTPPMFSALKSGGEKLYTLARKGIVIDRAPRKITIKKLEILSYKNCLLDLLIECSSGTYIRSMANDIGDALKCGGTLYSLRRLQIGEFSVEEALKEADFRNQQKIMSAILQLPLQTKIF